VTSFYGKYRGKVENNIDPMQMGRVQVSVPAVLGEGTLSWAMPCVPYAGPGVGFFAVPPNGANVWVEFEGGDTDFPIWTGCFWGTGEVPAAPALAEMKVIKTGSITLTLSDLPGAGGFTLEVNPPAVTTPLKLVFNASGIELSNSAASVKLTPASVSVNNGALEVI
jgi:Type VI secretion system/phage-baseplate injector OB domain